MAVQQIKIFKMFKNLLIFFTLFAGTIGVSKENGDFQIDPNSCQNRCNQTGTIPDGCQCNTSCQQFGDCCADYYTLCLGQPSEGSCQGKCGQPMNPSWLCQCNTACLGFGDCCPDYEELCDGGQPDPITDADLEALGEELFALEGDNPNNVAHWISWSLQGCGGGSGDNASRPLFSVNPLAYEQGTVKLMVDMFDNYETPVNIPEDVTVIDEAEENAFVAAVWETPIFFRLREFLDSKRVAFNQEMFKEMWFGLYSRSGNIKGSSGFEHVLMLELRAGLDEVTGGHGWAFSAKEEEEGNFNYRGWMEYADLGGSGALIQHSFTYRNAPKSISSLFVGTSPEFELAVFSVCWLTKPGPNACPMSFGNVKVKVTAFLQNGAFIGSAYADPANGTVCR